MRVKAQVIWLRYNRGHKKALRSKNEQLRREAHAGHLYLGFLLKVVTCVVQALREGGPNMMLSSKDLMKEAETLEQKLTGADLDLRLALQPRLSFVVDRLRVEGAEIPSRLRRLDAALAEEAVEAQFDNMPI